MKRILLLDGNSIMNSSFYGIPLLSTSEGVFTNAITGTLNVLLKYLKELKPEYCAVAFDVHHPTFRHEAYGDYKAGRKPMPEELRPQFPLVKECLNAIGVKIIESPGYEADDILGTCSAFAHEKDDYEAYIITGDRDSFQLIRDNVFVLYKNPKGVRLFDRKEFSAEYPGVTPESFIDYKAIVGDKSDNIKGVDGIGTKGALDLISEYHSVDNIYANLDKIAKKSLVAKLEAGKEDAKFSYFLSAILLDAPIGITIDDLKWQGPSLDKANEICSKLQLSKILENIRELGGNETITETNTDVYSLGDIERSGEITGTQISVSDDDKIYAYNGEKTFYLSKEAFLGLLNDETREIIVNDSKRIYSEYGSVRAKLFDVSLAAYVLSSAKEQDIKGMLMTYLHVSPIGEINKAKALFDISAVIKEKLNQTSQYKVYSDIELPLSEVLADMEKVGFRVDREGLTQFGKELEALCDAYTKKIYEIAGKEFNINSTKQLGALLFEELGLPSSKKTKSGYSTDIDVLEDLKGKHEIIEPIIEYRKISKLNSTYAVGLLNVADENGRIHSTFNQKVAATGRLSSSDPNLQNIPIRTELGRRMRQFFIPSKGYKLIDADYSQIELRVLASVSGDRNMCTAFILGEDVHVSTASSVFNVPISQVTSEMRKSAKTINFGIVYGMSAFTLASDIGVSRYEASEYIKHYFASYPDVDAFLKDSVAFAKQNGYVSTLFGRRRYIDELKAPKAMVRQFGERVAKNSPIQGTAADIIKIAMINVYNRLKKEEIDARLILQVHDELILEAEESVAEKAEQILKEEMENAIELQVPLIAESGIGDNWLECHE